MNVPRHILEGPKYIPSAKKAETVWMEREKVAVHLIRWDQLKEHQRAYCEAFVKYRASGFDTPTSVQLATNASQPPVPVSTIKSPGEIEFNKVARYSPGDIKWFELTPVAKDAWERSAHRRATARVQEASANKEIEAMKAAKDSEADFTARVCKALEGAGALVYVMAGGATSSGLPDRLVIHRDWAGFLEFKGPGGSLRENQRQTMVRCRERGFPAFVVRDGGVTGLLRVLSVETIYDCHMASIPVDDGKQILLFLKNCCTL